MNYNGAVFIVSHDRFFLNRVVTKVIEIENGALSMYMGNYRAYSEKKQQIRDAKLKEYFNQQREIKHQQACLLYTSTLASPFPGSYPDCIHFVSIL